MKFQEIMEKIFSVSELNREIKITLESSFDEIMVQGEISNFKAHYSGHWYFTLKDESSQISCVMWRGRNNYVFFTPQDGMKVLIKGRLSVYEVRGSYQIDVISMRPMGIGELQIAFEKLKEKLSKEGLFDQKYKKPIPQMPTSIGIVTSKDGAALRDVISVIRRRFPAVELILAHASVQGAEASSEIASAIEMLNKYQQVNVVILCRGGGSLEDLWPFNEEITARAIFKSKIPIVTGVGHEVDFTIADFVADVRAATPTAAAELVTPKIEDVIEYIGDFSYNSFVKINESIKNSRVLLRNIIKSYSFNIPESLLNNYKQKLDFSVYKFRQAFQNYFFQLKNEVTRLSKVICNSNPKLALAKGFAIVRQNDLIIKRVNEFNKTQESEIEFYDGKVKIIG